MIENLLTILSIGVTVITTAIAIMEKIKSKKKNRAVEVAKIVQKLPEYITEAEQLFGNGKGIVKLKYVLKEIKNDCIINNIEFDEEAYETEIEKILLTPQTKEGQNNG